MIIITIKIIMMTMIYNFNNMNGFHSMVITRTQTEQNAYYTIYSFKGKEN